MKRFTYYTIVKHFNQTWQNRFYDAMQWIDNQLYKIPALMQFEITFTSPRAAPVGGHDYWWFPEFYGGRCTSCDVINDKHWFKVWNAGISWMGIKIAAGVAIKCAKPPTMVCMHCNQQNIAGTQCCADWDSQEKEKAA